MTLHVAFVADVGAEEDAAWRWLEHLPGVRARRFPPTALEPALAETDVVWLHTAGSPLLPGAPRLAAFVQQGGGLLLTLRSAELVGALGIESSLPNDSGAAVWRHDDDPWWLPEFRTQRGYPHVRGIATYGPHPLVKDLHNGTYCWAPSEGEPHAWCAYREGARPAEGHVVGVERAYIVQHADRVVAWEYGVGRGRVLCIGAFVHFAAPDVLLRRQLETLVGNALRAVGSESPVAPRATWPRPGTAATSSEALTLPDPLDLGGALPEPGDDALAFAGPVTADAPWDLAGRRLFVAGREAAGIGEMWVHPHRVVASWQLHLDGEAAVGTSIAVGADALRRTLRAGAAEVTETVFVAPEHAVAVIEYRWTPQRRSEGAAESPAAEVDFTVDLRRMWPFPAGCGGNLRYRQGADARSAVVESESGDGCAAVLLGAPAMLRLGSAPGAVPVVAIRVAASLDEPLRLAIVGGTDRVDLDRTLRTLRHQGVAGLVRQRRQRTTTLREARLAVRSGDARFDGAVEWAKHRLDAFAADTPGVGRSLLAGYAPATPGWGEGRPGYAWYFGRDACWSAFALLAAGEFSLVRQVIRFLGDRQDVTGKVLHEATTSGQFHYDAADSSPLYLLLVARYLAWSGDSAFVASVWPKVERAFQYCVSTDTDGDGLIENARVGHGWIESGPLGGARVTLYLASIWRAALEGLARVAEALGNARMQAECSARAARAGAAIEERFYEAATQRYALDLRADGPPTGRETALLAVALHLGAVTPIKARPFLDALAGARFSAPWGVRLLPTDDPLFRPTGYHEGAVWPLFTGWASLAEYAAGRGDAGFAHLAANAGLAGERQRGAFDEVLHGLEPQAAGVCADQAWSAGMVVLPLVEGLLGVQPDAAWERLVIAPQLPSAWPTLEVSGLRCGASTYDLRLRRRGADLSIVLRRASGEPLWVTLAPWCFEVPNRAVLDDQDVRPALTAWGDGVRAAVSFQAMGTHELRVTLG